MCGRSEKLFAILLLVVVFCNAEVTVKDGGYSVLVSFSQNIHIKNGTELLENIKASLEDASEILHNAIGLHFSKVTFKIPTSWDTSEWNITTEDSSTFSSPKADFLVDGTDDVVFGKFPFAQQYGSCGTPGNQIIIPTAFFDAVNMFPRGITLAREWLKYRYGVFDENGYFKDPLYPLYYITPGSDPNNVKITECTNAEVTYNFLDQNGNNCSVIDKTLIERLYYRECGIKPAEENLENITSSLMYFQEDISTMQHICGKDSDHQHNSRAPNKHNALCQGQSIWDVVKKSPDFQDEITAEGYADIEYVYVQETKPKVVVAWENTKQIKNKGPIILNAIHKFIIDLPSGSSFNGFPFRSFVSKIRDYTLHDLNDVADKRRVMAHISSDFPEEENGDINIAISKALDILSSVASDSKTEGTIIVITKSIGNIDETLLQKLKDSEVCIMILFFNEGVVPEEIKNYASALPCGSLKEFSMTEKNETTFDELFKAMETILPLTVDDKATEAVKTEYLTKESAISIQVDDSAENVTFWVFSKKESENFKLKLNGEIKENALKTEIFGDVLALSYTSTQPGNIEFTYPYDTEQMLTQVTITSKAGKYFTGEVFIHDTSEKESPVQMPVIIYAFIRFGAYPVQKAKVSATIKTPDENNIDIELNDDGKGDPDITQNDGIYSRYFTSFSEKGEYTVTVTVRNNQNSTFGADKNAGYQTCCGSYINGDTSKLGAFSKVFTTTFTARSRRPDDGYKPSRIVDLRIDSINDDKIILKWTAPGEEADYGTASQYEIKLFCEEGNVTDCEIHKIVRVLNQPSPLNYGREQEVTIQILINIWTLSVGIVTINKKNKMSDLSNVIEIFSPIDKLLEITTTDPETSVVQASSVGKIIGYIITGILILICITIAIIYYLKRKSVYMKPKAHEIEENMNKNNQEVKSVFKATDHSIKSAPVKKIESFPVLLYTHDQIKDFKDKDTDPPLYKRNIPSKQWASLDAISNLRTGGDRDTKSLGSSSTIDDSDRSEANENDVESQTK